MSFQPAVTAKNSPETLACVNADQNSAHDNSPWRNQSWFVRAFQGLPAAARRLEDSLQVASPLERLRLNVSRGQIPNKEIFSAGETVTPSEKCELILEEMRRQSFIGNYSGVLSWAHEMNLQDAASTTQLTYFQVKAGADLELGNFGSAVECLQRSRDLGGVLQYHPALSYVDGLAAKMKLLEAQSEDDVRAVLFDLLNGLKSKQRVNLDTLLMVYRIAIFGKRLLGFDFQAEARVTLALAKALEDQLYEELAAFDIAVAISSSPDQLKLIVQKWNLNQPQIHFILRDLDESDPSSTTARSCKHYLLQRISRETPSEYITSSGLGVVPVPRVVIDTQLGVAFGLHHEDRYNPIEIGSRQILALKLATSKELGMDEFVRQLWGEPVYHKLEHGPRIRKLFSRLSKEVPSKIRIRGGRPVVDRSVVIL